MQEADNIVVIGANGAIIEQGTFNALNSTNGYIRSLQLDEQDSIDYTVDPTTAKLGPLIEKIAKLTKPVADADKDLLRRTGDFQVYKYYFKSIGWRHALTILGLTIGGEFCLFFPRKF